MSDNRGGQCECGCGQRTRPAKQNWTARGYVKGIPVRFVSGHNIPSHQEQCGPDYEIVDGIEWNGVPCWLWLKGLSSEGYGQSTRLRAVGESYAHRGYYVVANGPIPDGLQIDHLCRRPRCVNPAHLEAVTPAVNTRRSRAAKLTPQDVLRIRELFRCAGRSMSDISVEFGMSHGSVHGIVTRRRWKDIV